MARGDLARNTALLSLSAIAVKGINFVMIPLFSRWLSVEDYGTFDVISTYVALLIPFLTLSTSDAVFRFAIGENQETKKKYLTTALVLDLSLTVVASVIIAGISIAFPWNFAPLFILYLFAEIGNKYMQGALRAIRKLSLYALGNIATTVGIVLGVSFLVYVLELGLPGMIAGYALGYLIGDLVLAVSSKIWTCLSFRKASLSCCKEMLAYSTPLIPNSICWWVINASNRTVIGIFMGPIANGVYAIASKVPNACTSVFQMFGISWQEAAVDSLNDADRKQYYSGILNKTIVSISSVIILLLACNFLMFDYLFDAGYSEARYLLPILALSVEFVVVSQFYGGIQIGLMQPKKNGISTAVGALLSLVASIALVPIIGLYGACISTLLSNVAITVLRAIMLKDAIKYSLDFFVVLSIVAIAYYFICCYLPCSLPFLLFNLLLALSLFVFLNRDFISRIAKKVAR